MHTQPSVRVRSTVVTYGTLQIQIQIHKCFEMSGVDGRRVISKVILSSVEGSHLLMPSVCLFDIGVVCFYNMTDIRSDDHYNSDESVPGYSFER